MDINLDATTFASLIALIGLYTIFLHKLIFGSLVDKVSKQTITEKVTRTVSWCDKQDRSDLKGDLVNERLESLLFEEEPLVDEKGISCHYLIWIRAVVRQDSVEVFIEYLDPPPIGLRRYVKVYVRATLAEFRRQGIEAVVEAKTEEPISLKNLGSNNKN